MDPQFVPERMLSVVLDEKMGTAFFRKNALCRAMSPPQKKGGASPSQHLCVQLYFGQAFIIFAALAPPDGTFLRRSERHYSANGGGSIYLRSTIILPELTDDRPCFLWDITYHSCSRLPQIGSDSFLLLGRPSSLGEPRLEANER